MATAVAAWQALTQEQQSAWSAYAAARPRRDRLGQTRELSGYAAFTSAALAQISAFGFGTPTDPPQIDSPFVLLTLDMSVDNTGLLTIAWTNTPRAIGQPGHENAILLDKGSAVSAGVTFGPGPHGWRRLVRIGLAVSSPVSWPSGFVSGQTFFWRSREYRDDNVIGPPIIGRLTVP